ncbi:MAG: hypothetical protein K2Y22_05670 [Candidatus Obscuribacterales bacterium]|nr:hypothetical protein [Candidatus Obscuribacterales bacterium]
MLFRLMNLTRLSPWLLSAVLTLPVWAVTPEEITKTLKDAHILTPGYDIKPVLTNDSALITSFRNPQASDKDCKVDAVLITRKIIALDPQKFKTVEVYFYETKNPTQYTKMLVTADDINRFGSGKISQTQLMASVNVTKGQIKAQANPLGQFRQQSYTQILQRSDVVAGPMASERAQLLNQIRQLNGTKVDKRLLQTLSENFVLIEDLARYNQRDGLGQQINLLKDRIAQAGGMTAQPRAGNFAKPEAMTPAKMQEHPDFARKQQQMIDSLRNELGSDAPSPGPMLMERARAVKRIKQMQKFVVPEDEVDRLMRSYRDVDYIARHGSADDVARKMEPLNDKIEDVVQARQQNNPKRMDRAQPFDGPPDMGPGGERHW